MKPTIPGKKEDLTSEQQLFRDILLAVNGWYQREHSAAVKKGLARRREQQQDTPDRP